MKFKYLIATDAWLKTQNRDESKFENVSEAIERAKIASKLHNMPTYIFQLTETVHAPGPEPVVEVH